MKKCKNCGEKIDEHRKYCSLTCRNIYVNKNIRDYSKNGESLKKTYLEKYNSNPTFCISCGKKLPYEKRDNKYCDHSCAAKETNQNRETTFTLSKKGLKSLRDANKKRDYEKKKYYYSNIKRCKICNKMIPFNKRRMIFCNIKCKKKFYNENKTDYEIYRSLTKFKFNLKDYFEEFDFSFVEKFGWYKATNRGNNLNGVSRDHKFSVNEGFNQLINPLLLAHPANCELLVHNDNVSKNCKCSLELNELQKNIKIFEEKYGKYYKKEIKTYITTEELKEI